MALDSALYRSARFGDDLENGRPDLEASGASSLDDGGGGGGIGDGSRVAELAKGCTDLVDLAPVELIEEIVPCRGRVVCLAASVFAFVECVC
jgi:hypothetical protein